jgi:hypothetical protein
MKYPQCYVFLSAQAKLPALDVLQEWFETKRDLYVRGVSRTSKCLNAEIDNLENLHCFAFNRHEAPMQCIVFSGTELNPVFLWAHINDVLKVYWIDSLDHAAKMQYLYEAIDTTVHFDECLDHVKDLFNELENYVVTKLGKTLVDDSKIYRFLTGRHWGTLTEVEIYIKQIAKNETRAGVLKRLDLVDTH